MSDLLDQVTNCFTSPVATRIAALQLDAPTQERVDELARKCNEGELSDSERAEHEAYVEAMDTIALLQAKARARIAKQAS